MSKIPLTVADHLSAVAQKAVVSNIDKGVINTSVNILTTRLSAEFDKYVVAKTGLFGSFTRDTMLPSSMNPRSDVDIMVVFLERGQKPQIFIEKLKKFAELHYPKSAIVCGPSTISLELRHMRFELIPVIDSLSGLQIPTKGPVSSWQSSNPGEFDKSLKDKDKANQGLILPVIRLAKYWNALNQYPFDAFDIEKRIIAHSFALSSKNIKAYFFDFMRGLNAGPLFDAGRSERVRQLRKTLDEIDRLVLADQQLEAVMKMDEFLPLPAG